MGQAHTEGKVEWRLEVRSEGRMFPGLGLTEVEVEEWSRSGCEMRWRFQDVTPCLGLLHCFCWLIPSMQESFMTHAPPQDPPLI
jgi:hypothetical protein